MSIQPSGDYRLIPWAYPPIPGGSSSAGGSNEPLDFSSIFVSELPSSGANYQLTSSSTDVSYIEFKVNIRDIGVNNLSNVATVQLRSRVTEVEYPSASGLPTGNDAANFPIGTAELSIQSIQNGTVQTVTTRIQREGNPSGLTSRYSGGLAKLVANLQIYALDNTGAVLQKFDIPDPISYGA